MWIWDEFDINEWHQTFESVKLYWKTDLKHPELFTVINNFIFWVQGHYGYFNSQIYQNDHDMEIVGSNLTRKLNYNADLSYTLSLICYPHDLWTRIKTDTIENIKCSDILFIGSKNACSVTIKSFEYDLPAIKKDYLDPHLGDLSSTDLKLEKLYLTEPVIVTGSFDECWNYLK